MNSRVSTFLKVTEDKFGPVVLGLEGQNVWNFPYTVRIRWSRQPNLVPFYLYNPVAVKIPW